METILLDKTGRAGLECGACTGCCTAMGVPSINKPAGVACSKLIQIGLPGGTPPRASGCSVYGSHPPECRAYKCFWLQGIVGGGDLGLRPDKIGLVFGQETTHFAGPVLTAYECQPEASYSDRGRAVLDVLSMRTLVLIIRMDKTRTLIGPKSALIPAYDKMMKLVTAAGLENAVTAIKET